MIAFRHLKKLYLTLAARGRADTAAPPAAKWRRPEAMRALLASLLAWLAAILAPATAQAAVCNYATARGTTGPSDWQTYCWLDLAGYNNTAARSASGQNFSYTLPDGTIMTFNFKVTGAGVAAANAPSWSGAAVGNTAFLGIGGRPILYQTAAGTTTATISAITLTPPMAGSITNFMFVVADAESSNNGEALSFQTNGGGWQLLDLAGPISGSTYPLASGSGTGNFNVTGVAGTVGSHIVGSAGPTRITTAMTGGGLQGIMFAVRFASIRLNTLISGARINPADQFNFRIEATGSGALLASGTSSGAALGPFNAAVLSSTAAIPLTLKQTMASGSWSAIARYRSLLTCTNATPGSTTALPTNAATTSFNLGALQFGDNLLCTFTQTPYPHLTLTKVLGSGGRQFASDQFTLSITTDGTSVAQTTTTGTGSTLGSASIASFQAAAGVTYRFSEVGAGSTALVQYTAALACSNGATSSTPLPTSLDTDLTPAMGDVISCVLTNTRRPANATLQVMKSSQVVSDPVNGSISAKAIPGAIVRYSIAVQNSGPSGVDNNTLFLVDTLPPQVRVGTAASPVFIQGTPSSGLSFNAGTDLRYSNAVSPPSSFTACTYTPAGAYDPAVRYVCLRPRGNMAGSTGTPTGFVISFNSRLD